MFFETFETTTSFLLIFILFLFSSTSQNITHSTLICNTSHLNLLKFNELFYGSTVFYAVFSFFMYLYWKCICKTCLFLHLLYFRYVKKTFPAPLNTSSASVILCLKLFPDEESKIMTLLASYPTTRTASLLPVIANTGLPQLT